MYVPVYGLSTKTESFTSSILITHTVYAHTETNIPLLSLVYNTHTLTHSDRLVSVVVYANGEITSYVLAVVTSTTFN